MISVQRILVPVDFSPHAEAVVEWAAHLALEHDSEVILLHAYHLPVEFQQLEGAYLPADFSIGMFLTRFISRMWRAFCNFSHYAFFCC